MKKITTILLALFMVLSLGACTGNRQQSKDNTSDTVMDTDAGRQEAEETSEADDTKAEESEDESVQQNQAAVSENGVDVAGNDETADGVKSLVVYFSATNTTKGVAENLANGIGADIYEIVPEEPYTDADLDYNDNNSRTTIEMNDPDVRPAISGSVENMEQYDVIFLGYSKFKKVN